MPGMVVLISACRVSGGQLFEISFSHRCPSVVRMSACSFCCSFTRKLVQSFCCKVARRNSNVRDGSGSGSGYIVAGANQ